MLGLALGLGGLLGQGISALSGNKQIKRLMSQMQAPSQEPVDIARASAAAAQSMEQGQMPGTEAYQRMIRENQAKQVAAAERAGGDVIANAAAASAQAGEQAAGLAGQQAQFKMGAMQNTQQARQNLAQQIMQNQQLQNDFLQSKISGQSAMTQNWANLAKGVGDVGGGLMGMGKYLQGLKATSQNPDKINIPWYYR